MNNVACWPLKAKAFRRDDPKMKLSTLSVMRHPSSLLLYSMESRFWIPNGFSVGRKAICILIFMYGKIKSKNEMFKCSATAIIQIRQINRKSLWKQTKGRCGLKVCNILDFSCLSLNYFWLFLFLVIVMEHLLYKTCYTKKWTCWYKFNFFSSLFAKCMQCFWL